MFNLIKNSKTYDESSKECLKTLLKFKGDPNLIEATTKKTLLMYAALKGVYEMVKILVENQSNINLIDSENQNVLFYAVLC